MEYTTIGESCSVVSGGTPSRSKTEYWRNGTIPWIKIGNIKSKYVNEYDELITEQGLNNSSAKLLKKGTILYTIFATLGEVGILDTEACTNQAIAGISINDPRITTDYLYYYLKSKKDYVNNIGRGVAQNNINLTALKKFEIPLINVDKQLYIVEVLEKVERLIGLKKKEIDDLDLLIKARFVELFGDRYINDKTWPSRKLGDCISFNNGKAHEQVVDENGEYILVTSRAIASDFLDVRRTNALLFPLHKNDIVMVMSDVPNGRALAKCQLIDEDEKYTLNQRICSFDNYDYNPIFLLYLLNRHQYFLDFDDGNSQTNLRKNDILRCNLINPPMELQDRFAEFVKQVDKSKLAVQQSLEKTQLLFDSLMQEYFGEN